VAIKYQFFTERTYRGLVRNTPDFIELVMVGTPATHRSSTPHLVIGAAAAPASTMMVVMIASFTAAAEASSSAPLEVGSVVAALMVLTAGVISAPELAFLHQVKFSISCHLSQKSQRTH
jgi:hypothetical protein